MLKYEIALRKAEDEIRRAQSQSVVDAAKRGPRGGWLADIRVAFGAALIAAGQWVKGTAEAGPRPAAATSRG